MKVFILSKLQPLADLKEKQCSPPYLKDRRTCKSNGIAKTKVGEGNIFKIKN